MIMLTVTVGLIVVVVVVVSPNQAFFEQKEGQYRDEYGRHYTFRLRLGDLQSFRQKV